MTGDLFRQYMLARTDEAQRDQFRERLLADQALSDQLKDQENDWIDAYAAGTLPPADAALLYQHLTDTGQLSRIPTAAALIRKPAKPQSIFPYSLALAAALFLCFTALFQSEYRRPSTTSSTPPELPLLSFSIAPGALRAGQPISTLHAEPNQPMLLQLLYQDTAPTGTCRVTLSHLGEPKPIESADAECGIDFHAFNLPRDLPAGRYSVNLSNTKDELIHTYVFLLTR